MADNERKLQDETPEKERFADQQFGAQAARDQEAVYGEPSTDTDSDQPTKKPRDGNKA